MTTTTVCSVDKIRERQVQAEFKSLGKDAHESLYGLSLRLYPTCEGGRWDGGGAPEWESRERHRGSLEAGAKIIFHVVVKFAHLHLPRRTIRFHGPGEAENPSLLFVGTENLLAQQEGEEESDQQGHDNEWRGAGNSGWRIPDLFRGQKTDQQWAIHLFILSHRGGLTFT